MNDPMLPATTRTTEGLVALTYVIYGLHAFSAGSGLLSPAFVVTAFLTGWPSIIAVIINYLRQSEVRGTWLESHFRWQIRTFWFAFLWIVVAAIVSAPLVLLFGLGIVTFYLAAVVIAIWIVYRVARGWIALRDKRTMFL